MNYLDIFSLIIFFVGIGFVGYISTKKIKSSKQYILADRKLTKFQAGISMAASDMGGSSIVGASAYVYVIGLSGAFWNLSAVPALIILGFIITKKLRNLEISTVPEFIGNRYSNRLRLFTSILHILGLSTMVSAQFLVSATAINVLLGVPQNIALIISLLIVLLYTAGGGLIAVVNTDVVQFFVMIISMLVMIPACINNIGSIGELINNVPKEFLSFRELGFWTPFSWVLLCVFLYGTNQTYLQRVFASKDAKTASFSFYFTGLAYIVYGCIIGFLGLAMYVILPNLSDPNLGFALLIQKVLPSGVTGIALGGLFAATMSTADSMLIGASSLFVNDVYCSYINKNASDKQILNTTRIVTIVVAIGGIVISKLFDNLVDIVYVSGLLYSAVVFFPLILGLFNDKISSASAEISIAVAFIVGLLSEFYLSKNFGGILGLPSNILCSLTGLIVLLALTYLPIKKSKLKSHI